MNKVSQIGGRQLVLLLLASRLSGCLLFSSDAFADFTVIDCILSMFLGGVFLFILFLPTLLLLRGQKEGITGLVSRRSLFFGKTLDAVYLFLCLFILCMDIVQFSDFAQKIITADISVTVLVIVFIGVCFLSSLYGIQALGRAAALIVVFAVFCFILFDVSLVFEMKAINFPPETFGGFHRILNKALHDLPQTAEVVAIGLLYPYVNGKPLAGCAVFSGLTVIFSLLVSLTAVGVLGDFSAMTAYPYYAAVTAAQIGVFQRLDVLITAVWLGTFFVRFTLFALLLTDQSRRLFGNKATVPTAVAATVLLSLFAVLIGDGSFAEEWSVLTEIYWWVAVIVCLILPLVIPAQRRKKA